MTIRQWISAHRKRAILCGAGAGLVLLVWLFVWLGSDHVRSDLEAVIILDGPGGKAMVPLDSPSVLRDPAGLLERNIAALLERLALRGKGGEATEASIAAAVCPVEVHRGNWARVRYQIGRLLGRPDPGMAFAVVGAPRQESAALLLRRTPQGALYLSTGEGRAGMIHTDLIPRDDRAAGTITRLLLAHWSGWPQKDESRPAGGP
jgi:hypothetical protein